MLIDSILERCGALRFRCLWTDLLVILLVSSTHYGQCSYSYTPISDPLPQRVDAEKL